MKTIKILLITLLTSINLFAGSVATITALRGSATIERDGNIINATLGAKLEEKDTVLTKENAKVQIIFKDETVISIGKNSNFSIKEYIFEENKEPVAKFNMIKGAMRTITGRIGKIAPQKFSVTTKTATIGIRGTNFSVVVGNDGSYNAFCTYGAISVTIKGEEHIVKQGFFIIVTPAGKVEIKEFTPEDLKNMKKENFGTTKQKGTDASKGTDQNDNGENSEQLDVTVTDDSGIIIKDVSDTVGDVTQVAPSLSDLIAGYTMNNASYTGTYTVSDNGGQGSLVTGNRADLNINFGNDASSLMLYDNGSTPSVVHTFNTTPTITGTTLSIKDNVQAPNQGSVTGTFQGTTGNQVTGNWNYFVEGTATGTFDVTSSQTLH